MSNVLSPEEMNTFRSLTLQRKADSMELYLIGGRNGAVYNMQEVGLQVFGSENYSYTVSLIHRAYCFSGQNKGRYKPGCAFERKYGHQVTRADIEAFLRRYPQGSFREEVTFEDFLLRFRVKGASNWGRTAPGQGSRRSAGRPSAPIQEEPDFEAEESWAGGGGGDVDIKKIMRIILLACVTYFVFALYTGFLLEHLILSVVIALMLIGAIYALREM